MTTHVSQSPTASPPLTTPSITSSSASSSSRKVDLKAAFLYFPSKFALLRLLVAGPLLHRPTHMIWPSNGRGSSGRFPNTSHSQPGATTRWSTLLHIIMTFFYLLVVSRAPSKRPLPTRRKIHCNFRLCLEDMVWPIAENKVDEPCRDLVIFGIHTNVERGELSLPGDKLDKIMEP
jgi:hypothetical protein